ncbi:transcriptional regulator [Anaerococcus porci]|uniref:transcriptional regulator n=2 Tax=Anaerococcus TaxID=165779 RepID=UPI002A76555A|nr:transcriptional regulator [Anaerococcus porci]MDY3006317.1 transcriptional regulator [Anaerococcus porci]
MKKDLLERLETEVKACKRYVENSIKKSKEGKIGAAVNLLDIAGTAKKCADQVHEELWEESKGNLTEEEFKLFAESETLDRELKKAYKEIKKARK